MRHDLYTRALAANLIQAEPGDLKVAQMYILYCDDARELECNTRLFDEYMEPLLRRLDAACTAGTIPEDFIEIQRYREVCRWPFRRLEYALVIDRLLDTLKPGDMYLDAGAGVTPLAHVFAALDIEAYACDLDERVVQRLHDLNVDAVYESRVSQSAQDLTRLSFPDNTFDAVSCVSVLEHIPAPFDQVAIRELLRVLKPGGTLMLTVDFEPVASNGRTSQWSRYARRSLDLLADRDVRAVLSGIRRKRLASQAARQGNGHEPRSANQSFQLSHLARDIIPAIDAVKVSCDQPFCRAAHQVEPRMARQFWDIEPGLFDKQGRRTVLPAAMVAIKSH